MTGVHPDLLPLVWILATAALVVAASVYLASVVLVALWLDWLRITAAAAAARILSGASPRLSPLLPPHIKGAMRRDPSRPPVGAPAAPAGRTHRIPRLRWFARHREARSA